MKLGKCIGGVLLSAALLLVGCQAKSGPDTYPVSGTVTYQGKAVKQGQILFVPDATQVGGGPTSGCEIIDGNFVGKSTAGAKRVEIYGSWETGKTIKMDDGTGEVPQQASIPSKYNEGSKLEVELKPETNDNLKFELK